MTIWPDPAAFPEQREIAFTWLAAINNNVPVKSKRTEGKLAMKKAMMGVVLAISLLPASVFAHDNYYPNRYGWRDRVDRRVVRAGDPGYYCHRHRGDGRIHCHSTYNDPHGIVSERASSYPRWRR